MNVEDLQITKQVDEFTKDTANILTRYYIDISGSLQQVGQDFRQPYENSLADRELLIKNEPEDIANAILTLWGDTPTVTSPINPLKLEEDEEGDL